MQIHVLRHDASPSAPPGAPAHLLVHGLGTAAWSWLDVIPRLARHGPVVAIDLPGSGYSRPRIPRDAAVLERVDILLDVHRTLGLGRTVLHGHSLGGIVAAMLAGRAPDRFERLVLASTPLPGAPTHGIDALAWRIIGRGFLWIAPFAGPIALRAMLRWQFGDRRSQDGDDAPVRLPGAFTSMGGDPGRISPELRAVIVEEIDRFTVPWRASGAMVATASVIAALTVDQDATRAAVDAVTCPTLNIVGGEDRLIPDRLRTDIERRHPAWHHERLDTYGHLIPWEGPDRYVNLVTRWLAAIDALSEGTAGYP